MGGKIPRKIKEKVVRAWLKGLPRATIAKNNDVGEGTVTNIIKDASLQEEYQDMELFRQLALVLNENGLEPVIVGFAVRLLKIMEDNGIDVNQVEPKISNFATYCFKHQISFDTLIQSGYEALSLEKELGVPVKMLSEHITRAKKTREELLDLCQKQLRKLRDAPSEYDAIKREEPLIVRIIKLEEELRGANEKIKQCEQVNKRLEKDLGEANYDMLRAERARVETDDQLKTIRNRLSLCMDRLDRDLIDKAKDKNYNNSSS